VFPEQDFDELTNEDGSIKESIDSSKIFKIKYSINLLPQIGTHIQFEDNGEGDKLKHLVNHDIPFMKIIAQSEELDIFNTISLQDLIEFKWNEFGMMVHLVGCMMHMCQIAILIFYVHFIYIENHLCKSVITGKENKMECEDNVYAIVLLGGIIYPFIYEIA
jgi:hypothetical protein